MPPLFHAGWESPPRHHPVNHLHLFGAGPEWGRIGKIVKMKHLTPMKEIVKMKHLTPMKDPNEIHIYSEAPLGVSAARLAVVWGC